MFKLFKRKISGVKPMYDVPEYTYTTPFVGNHEHVFPSEEEMEEIKQTVDEMLDGYDDSYLRYFVKENIQYAIKNLIVGGWSRAVVGIPELMECEFEDCISLYCDRFKTTAWLLEYEDGRKEVRYPSQNKGWVITGDYKYMRNMPAEFMPSGVVKAMRVVLGSHATNENQFVGFHWKLFVKEK